MTKKTAGIYIRTRVPAETVRQIDASAQENHRSRAAEVAHRVRQTFAAEPKPAKRRPLQAAE